MASSDASRDKARKLVEGLIQSYDCDPADNDFQRGYLAALEDVRRELIPQAQPTLQ